MKRRLLSLFSSFFFIVLFFLHTNSADAQVIPFPTGPAPTGINLLPPVFPTLLPTVTPFPTFPPPSGPCVRKIGEICIEVSTALGNIQTDPAGFVKGIFTILLSISGGIALIIIMISGYTLMISRGNPEKMQGAKDTLTSAIVGLLFIIFSIAILQVIGYDILRIPGFSP